MSKEKVSLLWLFLKGCVHVLIVIAILSLLLFWVLQSMALFVYDEIYDWQNILGHIILSMTFLAFFPGQRFWTHQVEDDEGRCVTIIGDDSFTD